MSEVVKAGELKPISITTRDRQARKHVTSVVGVESFAIDPAELATLIQKKFAAACSVQALPGKDSKGYELQAQGALNSKIQTYLCEEFGIPAHLVHIVK